MKKSICVVTATRAEYGLLKSLIMKIGDDPVFDLRLAVTGTHLSPEFGMTISEIEEDEIQVDKKIEIVLGSDTPVAISKSMGLAMISFAEYFEESRPDALIVLGDRYETLAICCAAMNARIPIFHLCGGEATEGLIDEAIRHAITKMSYLHFASTKTYRERIIQMGESPDRVYYTGAPGVENVLNLPLMTQAELEDSIDYKLGDNYAVGTFHPVTLEQSTAEEQVMQLLSAIERYPDIRFLFTKANADADGRIINRLLEEYADGHTHMHLVDSLGVTRYLSALKHAQFVIGNSSSGLMEAPAFGITTVDIGDRQKGRIAGESVLHCNPDTDEIDRAIIRALSEEQKEISRQANNPYGDGRTSERIMDAIREWLLSERIDIKKKFYDFGIQAK